MEDKLDEIDILNSDMEWEEDNEADINFLQAYDNA
jgi:hypothetical protein